MSEPVTSHGGTPVPSRPGSKNPSRASSPSKKGKDEAAAVTSSTDANGSPEKTPDDSNKLKTFLGILRKFIGVADIAAVRFSLPAQLIEPIPNLEYWSYLDRPETFVCIPDSKEPLGRMLATLRFWFTKDLKYVKGKPCKPYNSTLGEFFRCNWEVEDTLPPPKYRDPSSSSSSASASIASSQRSSKEGSPEAEPSGKKVKVSFLTEQTSHHPPISAFYIDCPEKGVSAKGFDQLSAKFTGTSVRVVPGSYNLGIFITLHRRDDEQYQLTHPAAHLGGLLRGSLSVTVADSCFVSCPKTRMRVILQYLEDGWLGKAQNKVEGVIFTYDPDGGEASAKTKIRDVPEKDILARIEGCWWDKIYYTLGSQPFAKASEKQKILLIDLSPLYPVPKLIPPQEQQLPNESRRFWAAVTDAITSKQFSRATQLKHEIEERQRAKAAERKDRGADWRPRFFTEPTADSGRPTLSDEGRKALKGLQEGNFELEESEETGA